MYKHYTILYIFFKELKHEFFVKFCRFSSKTYSRLVKNVSKPDTKTNMEHCNIDLSHFYIIYIVMFHIYSPSGYTPESVSLRCRRTPCSVIPSPPSGYTPESVSLRCRRTSCSVIPSPPSGYTPESDSLRCRRTSCSVIPSLTCRVKTNGSYAAACFPSDMLHAHSHSCAGRHSRYVFFNCCNN